MKRQQSCTPNTGNGGNYYSFGAATAGGKQDTLNEAQDSVCPRGWLFTRYEGNKSYRDLGFNIYKSNSEQINSCPISILRSGNFYSKLSVLRDRGKTGYYIVNKSGDYQARYVVTFSGDSIDYDYNNRFDFGFSLRCVAR